MIGPFMSSVPDHEGEFINNCLNINAVALKPEHIRYAQQAARGIYIGVPEDVQQHFKRLLYKPPPKGTEDDFGYVHLVLNVDGTFVTVLSVTYTNRDIIKMYIDDNELICSTHKIISCLWDQLPLVTQDDYNNATEVEL